MERFLPILNTVQVRLREILSKNEVGMLSWDVAKLKVVGEDLLELSVNVCPQLAQVEHRILYQSIKEAGLGIRRRVTLIEKRQLEEKDKEYFRSVHEALLNICEKIESGEYYRALVDMANKKAEKEGDYPF